MNLETRLRSRAMRLLASAGFQRLVRRRARILRAARRQPRAVHYFHQVDDPYSHLAVQKLDLLRETYRVPFVAHLAAHPDAAYQGSAEHFDAWAMRDAASVAADFATRFPAGAQRPEPAAVATANAALAGHLGAADFAPTAVAVGEALWTGDGPEPSGGSSAATAAVAAGNALRARLGHYLGGMFYYDGEWYWGVDRLRYLEQRLIDEGLANGAEHPRVPEPTPENTSGLAAGHVTLEYFPSLRSPYTAVGHRRIEDLVRRSGVTVVVRPVMPMLMRGVPAPRAKQRYIISDASREARARGVRFGRIVDPFGAPVRRAFALYAGAAAMGRELDFVRAYLESAWADGIDITTRAGLQIVAARARIDWAALEAESRERDWEALLAANLEAMLAAGLWGVPSFRVTGGRIDGAFACWGQDRIWRVESEITRRA